MDFRKRPDCTSNSGVTRNGTSNNRLLTLLLAIVSLVAIVGYDGAEGYAMTPSGKRIWTVGHGHSVGAFEYFDQKGYIKGFSQELIDAVCNAADIECSIVWAPYEECWTSEPGQHPSGGRGLLDGWYDACTAYPPTVERIQVFDFSLPHIKSIQSRFYIKKGKTFNPYDLKGKKIGFIIGFSSNEKCVAHAASSVNKNYVLSTDQIVYADGASALEAMLVDETIDAAFAKHHNFDGFYHEIEEVADPAISCALGGNAMMTRKDNGFIAEWNRGLQKLISSGQYRKLCQEAKERHGAKGNIWCID